MKRFSHLLAASVLSACLVPGVVHGATVNFDDLDASAGDVDLSLLSTYAGLSWSNTLAYTNAPGLDGFNNAIVSAANAAYSGGELSGQSVVPIVGQLSASSLFDFESVHVGAGYYDDLQVTFTGLRGGVVQFSQSVTVGTGGAQAFSFGFTSIDTLRFQSARTSTTADPFACGTFNCTQFTLDNLSITLLDVPPPPTGVPEPSSLALVLVAAWLGLRARKA